MANIKSAKKRIRVNARKAARNKSIRTGVKTRIKKVIVAIENNNVEEAKVALVDAIVAIDKATTKGLFHKKAAARKKSSLTKQVNKIA